MRRCKACGQYVLAECDCDESIDETEDVGPGKFSPDDEYVSYRVKYKEERGEL